MQSLLIIFGISLVLTALLVGIKMAEVDRGRRVLLPHFRELIDQTVDAVPGIVSRETRLVLARLSLQGHSLTTWSHNIIEIFRGFFRRRTIKLFASVHSETPPADVKPGSSSFWRKIKARKSDLTRK